MWEKDTNKCFVEMYLSSMCFRLAYSNQTDIWSLDVPPYQSLDVLISRTWSLGDNVISYGCEPSVEGNLFDFMKDEYWLPFVYSHDVSKNITVTVWNKAIILIPIDSSLPGSIYLSRVHY